ncbi:MAG: FadR/GntR family transcriptional regulator [bacterium]|nr:FadR family transcriptional regulator [Acidimicrobiia bacterium]MCY4650378.1 FadR/GntR family transcriptional regulator [bacterium]
MSRLSREATRVLMGDIISGRYSQGEKLPKENALTERFGASRGTIRESVRALEERGLVKVTHGVGAVVQPSEHWNILDADVLDITLATDRSDQVLGDFLETRRILEVEAVALAAERGSEEQLHNIREAFDRVEEAAKAAIVNPLSEPDYLKTDAAFHSAILNAAGNSVLGKMLEPLRRAIQAAMRPLSPPRHRIMRRLPEYEQIMKTVTNRDVEGARAAIEEHLASSRVYLESVRT